MISAILNNVTIEIAEDQFDDPDSDVIIGEVMTVGDDVKAVEVGDEVFFGKYSGQILNREDETVLLVIKENQILAINE